MPQDIIPPGVPVKDRTLGRDQETGGHDKPKRFRLSVGVVLGLVFSIVLVLICGGIITYMTSASRNVAGRLLLQQASANLSRYETVLTGFFDQQTALLQSLSISIGSDASQSRFTEIAKLFPSGSTVRVLAGRNESQPGQVEWNQFVLDPETNTAVMSATVGLVSGQRLSVQFPQSVFADLTSKMDQGDELGAFLLMGRDQVVSFASEQPNGFNAQAAQPLARLADYPSSPISSLWTKSDDAHPIRGGVKGRVFPHQERMYAMIYDEVESGPAKGWTYGALYQAHIFGATLDRSQIILFVAVGGLLVGAVISFTLGRIIGRPLDDLAQAAVNMQNLEFDKVQPLQGSHLIELDQVNRAFNSASGALHAFSKYVPKQLVRQLVDDGLTGTEHIETREMTIVFTDLAGFTGKASHLTAEETAGFLGKYFETVSEQVVAESGTIDKFLGDGVMAFWGAPSYQPDHAAQAIASVRALAEAIEAHPDGDMRVRIGVHTGEVVVGNIGSSDRLNYTVIGDAVNVAARLQEYGKSVDPSARTIILASADTLAQLNEPNTFEHIGSTELRGREEPVDIFRVA
ncbi:adenylate cyclase 2 [Roseibium sp. TrichSKD4]|uniref:adenylate/guanylate cyclase domain-containing protein n=1 Tax=Roseibium sp. TrichSKD4 TaxID=744980 RepID=UPI0001E56363|nr:adenylate/guanylate cyclase domain-containing protein [Roseibium sp. TrichSKD4]EFO34574.1 adenylate cyclase 2 [Roseibium sp. TrichSKD4]